MDRLRPVQALLAAAGVAASARTGHKFGIEVTEVSVDFTKVMDHARAAIQHIAPVDSVEALEKASVSVRTATAWFTEPDSAEIDETPLRFRQALVATRRREHRLRVWARPSPASAAGSP